MSAESEMRAILEHAAAKLEAAKDCVVVCRESHSTHNGPSYNLPKDVLIALAYADGVLRLLATYLKVGAEPEVSATETRPKPEGRPPDAPRDEHGRYAKTPTHPEGESA